MKSEALRACCVYRYAAAVRVGRVLPRAPRPWSDVAVRRRRARRERREAVVTHARNTRTRTWVNAVTYGLSGVRRDTTAAAADDDDAVSAGKERRRGRCRRHHKKPLAHLLGLLQQRSWLPGNRRSHRRRRHRRHSHHQSPSAVYHRYRSPVRAVRSSARVNPSAAVGTISLSSVLTNIRRRVCSESTRVKTRVQKRPCVRRTYRIIVF